MTACNQIDDASGQYSAEVAGQTVPMGYKKTEVGVIPEEWDVSPLYSLVLDGRIPSGLYKDKKLYGEGTPIIKLGDVFGNDLFNPSVVQKVLVSDTEIKNYSVCLGDLIIALASVKLEGVGKIMLVDSLEETTVFDHNVALIRFKNGINPGLMSYVFKSNYIRSLVASRATQVGTTFLKTSTILEFPIALPENETEQTAIANALSDVDALINELEKLIAKKQAIKTATMQQLLTGRTRLPQFALREDGTQKGYKQSELGEIPNDWDLVTIDDVANFSGGSQPPRSTFVSSPKAGYIRLIQIRDYKTSEYETYIPELFAKKKCDSNDIMIGRYGPPIFQILRGIEGAYNVALIKASPKEGINQEYLYYVLKSEKLFELMDMLSQRSSGQTGVELPALKAYLLPLPSKLEQTAIATVLSDMDTDIQTLQQRLSKTRQIKQGMMQELLTGRIRLVS